MSKKDKITVITIASVTVLLVVALIIALSFMLKEPEDDGLILKGVNAAGVVIGGMTPEQAKIALEQATANTYTELDMSVTVLESTILLSPQDTGARLDIESVVADAFNYGRTGSRAERQKAKNDALTNSYNVPITSYLNLNTEYIRNAINELGAQFNSTLSDPTITVTGVRPQIGVPTPDTTMVHQEMIIKLGTPEYGLDTNELYNKVMDYYNMNIFKVTGKCDVRLPKSIDEDLMEQYELLCVEPIDAEIDPVTYAITPETYGYGFDLEEVKETIAKASPGTELKIPLTYIEPNLTSALLSSDLFKDILSEYTSNLGIDRNWNSNVSQACKALDGKILKSGETFSFNEILGELTIENDYVATIINVGNTPTSVIGGGVEHVASVLYNCVMQAGLEIVEHHNHTYATNFIELGRDAYVQAGKADFQFRNSMPDPIRLSVKVVNNAIVIQIIGTDNRDHLIEIESLLVNTIVPGQLYNYMQPNNPGGYTNGQVILPGIMGYDVEIYRYKYEKETGRLLEKELLYTLKYEALDAVVVRLQLPEDPTLPTDPSIPSDPTDPNEPDNPTDPTDNVDQPDELNPFNLK